MLEGFNSMATEVARDIDQAFWINFWVSIVLFLSVFIPLVYLAWKYRESNVKDEDIQNYTHNTSLEIAWTLIPTAMLMVLFYYGYTSMRTARTMPAADTAITIQLEGKKWSWNYSYPANANGFVHAKTAKLYVPKDQNIILEMTAPLNDVLHAWYVPAFRMKEDVVPGRITKQWFNSNTTGNFVVECAEYCGTRHSYMFSEIVVMERAAYDEWFNSEKKFPGAPDKKISKGEAVYDANGCSGCHSITDDSVLVGPSLMGIGSKFDNAYLKDAIVNPDKDVPEGFYPGVMPPFNHLSDEDVKELLNFIAPSKEAAAAALADAGKVVYEDNGCNGCHSIDDDSILVGPSLKGISATKDHAYLVDAIANPDKDVPAGFTAGVMPPFSLSDSDMKAVTAYIESK